jgi:hypothetical protein
MLIQKKEKNGKILEIFSYKIALNQIVYRAPLGYISERMHSTENGATFHLLLSTLRVRVAHRIAEGEITERALARRAGISQPHLHNVLKGIRTMTPDVADRLLEALHLPLEELTAGALANGGRPALDRE